MVTVSKEATGFKGFRVWGLLNRQGCMVCFEAEWWGCLCWILGSFEGYDWGVGCKNGVWVCRGGVFGEGESLRTHPVFCVETGLLYRKCCVTDAFWSDLGDMIGWLEVVTRIGWLLVEYGSMVEGKGKKWWLRGCKWGSMGLVVKWLGWQGKDDLVGRSGVMVS